LGFFSERRGVLNRSVLSCACIPARKQNGWNLTVTLKHCSSNTTVGKVRVYSDYTFIV
jgi:hypothetical protein